MSHTRRTKDTTKTHRGKNETVGTYVGYNLFGPGGAITGKHLGAKVDKQVEEKRNTPGK